MEINKLLSNLLSFILRKEVKETWVARLIVTILPVLLSICVALRPKEFSKKILDTASSIRSRELLEIHWYESLYAIICLAIFFLWMRSLVNFMVLVETESRIKLDKAVEDIKTVIYRAPNFRAYENLDQKYAFVMSLLSELDHLNNDINIRDKIAEFDVILKQILEYIVSISARFLNKDEQLFSSNFMLSVNNPIAETEIHKFIEIIRKEKEVSHYGHAKTSEIASFLHLVPTLNFSNHKSKPSMVNLPILRTKKGELPQVLPGACKALLKGEFCVEDTLDINKYYQGFSDSDKAIALNLFKKEKDKFRSYVSIKIPEKKTPELTETEGNYAVGILNVNHKDLNILGIDETFYSTYYSVISPIVLLVAPYIEEYRRMYIEQKLRENS